MKRHDVRMIHVSQYEDLLVKSLRLGFPLYILFFVGFKGNNVTRFFVDHSADKGKCTLAYLESYLEVQISEGLVFKLEL